MTKIVAKLCAVSFTLAFVCLAPALAQTDGANTIDTPIEDKWALIVGISKFQDAALNLQYPAKDATDFYNYLVDEAHFAADHVQLLTDENATKERIMTELGDRWLPRLAHANDLVVIFISSHGSPSTMDQQGTNYVVAYNTDVKQLYATGLPMQDLVTGIRERVHANRVVLILDACHSGGARTAPTKGMQRATNFDSAAVAQGTGQLVICSSMPNQVSWESQRYANGVFTAQLLSGLRSRGDKTKLVEAFNVLKDNVETEVLHDRGESQTPVKKMTWEGNDLILAVVPSKPHKATLESSTVAMVPGAGKSASAREVAANAPPEPELRARELRQATQDALPEMQKNLNEIVQGKVAWDIDWQSFGSNIEAIQNLQYQGLDRILQAARGITSDSVGKASLKGAIKKISVANVNSMAEKRISFSKGLLELHGAWGLGWDGYPSVDQIRKAIENGL